MTMLTPQIPVPQLAKALGLNANLYLKREDLHPFGSHKGRSIPLMIKKHRRQGVENFVISSSGNAALAAIQSIIDVNNNDGKKLSLTVVAGKNIDKKKMEIMKKMIKGYNDKMIKIKQVSNPKQSAFQMEKAGKAKWLRQSTDNTALIGYHELAGELADIPSLSAVFIPTSSGTTAQGLHEGFNELGLHPQIHIVQTEACHPMVQSARAHGHTPARQKASLATAIIDRVAHRKQKVLETIKNSRGAGWVVSDEEIISAMSIVKETSGINISPNSALSVAGLKKSLNSGGDFQDSVVCLITGK